MSTFSAQEEDWRYALGRLQHHHSHFVRSREEAEALNRQNKLTIDRQRDELAHWLAYYQASQLEQKTLTDQLTKEMRDHLAVLIELQDKNERCFSLEAELELARRALSSMEQDPQQTECSCEIGNVKLEGLSQ
ncbi:hypothetical protein EMCG_08556 [[Emmonsia] crescens]|uniref:Uncharacterized protein n=1 Tax=[Emmonsia] crescens TaxID=73230 RepID=A0A0G2I5U1_9EURO|nr:hypothetical protein EMCG_08556 [Emmonsia crescens UAMH 3008]